MDYEATHTLETLHRVLPRVISVVTSQAYKKSEPLLQSF